MRTKFTQMADDFSKKESLFPTDDKFTIYLQGMLDAAEIYEKSVYPIARAIGVRHLEASELQRLIEEIKNKRPA